MLYQSLFNLKQIIQVNGDIVLCCWKGVTIGSKREIKSEVFSMLLENPEYALQVFNALNGSNFTDAGEVQMYNLREGASLLRRNDAAFILGMHLNIYEHQSTVNPNIIKVSKGNTPLMLA